MALHIVDGLPPAIRLDRQNFRVWNKFGIWWFLDGGKYILAVIMFPEKIIKKSENQSASWFTLRVISLIDYVLEWILAQDLLKN